VPNTKANEEILTAARALLEPVVEARQVELYDLELLIDYGRRVLRLYIEKEGGVSLDDCERITYAVEPVLDANDPVPGAYVLEVSSPGIERKLVKDSHYRDNMGKPVEIKLNKPFGKRKKFQGMLIGLDEEAVVISTDLEEELRLPREHLAQCRLVYMERKE
jgi:ribosome maturation factor RimP